jgi:hypothetical protein
MNAALNLRRLGLALGLLAVSLAGLAPRASAEAQAAASPDIPKWSDIKSDTYDQRGHFAAGAARLAARLDVQIGILRAKRAKMTTDTKDWDLAMKEVDDSRSYLAGCLSDIAQATTPDVWADRKAKVGDSWKRSQLAVDAMHTTVTD